MLMRQCPCIPWRPGGSCSRRQPNSPGPIGTGTYDRSQGTLTQSPIPRQNFGAGPGEGIGARSTARLTRQRSRSELLKRWRRVINQRDPAPRSSDFAIPFEPAAAPVEAIVDLSTEGWLRGVDDGVGVALLGEETLAVEGEGLLDLSLIHISEPTRPD